MDKWPSQQLNKLLKGEIEWDEAPEPIRSVARFYVYQGAVSILKLPKSERRAAIDKAPPSIRPKLEAEIIRIAPLLRQSATSRGRRNKHRAP